MKYLFRKTTKNSYATPNQLISKRNKKQVEKDLEMSDNVLNGDLFKILQKSRLQKGKSFEV